MVKIFHARARASTVISRLNVAFFRQTRRIVEKIINTNESKSLHLQSRRAGYAKETSADLILFINYRGWCASFGHTRRERLMLS